MNHPRLTAHAGALVVALAMFAPGCDGTPQPPVPAADADADAHGAHQAPPGWCGVALGDHVAHLAVKVDPATGTLDVHIFDGHFEAPVRIRDTAVVVRVKLPPGEFVDVACGAVADPLSGETVGDASTFRGRDDALMASALAEFDAVFLGATIKGQPFGEVPFPYPAGVKLH